MKHLHVSSCSPVSVIALLVLAMLVAACSHYPYRNSGYSSYGHAYTHYPYYGYGHGYHIGHRYRYCR